MHTLSSALHTAARINPLWAVLITEVSQAYYQADPKVIDSNENQNTLAAIAVNSAVNSGSGSSMVEKSAAMVGFLCKVSTVSHFA